MKLREILASFEIHDDVKARRVLNVSEARAAITAEEIERGVTLERLSLIGVPVFRYATQITIHGVIPDFNPDVRVGGYKQLTKNQNGSVGVRYAAIDQEKKELIEEVLRAMRTRKIVAGAWDDDAPAIPGDAGFTAHRDSLGLHITKSFVDRAACLSALNAFPRDLIVGGVSAGATFMGTYLVVASVNAIPEANVWPMIAKLTGLANAEAYARFSEETQRLRDAKEAANAAAAAEKAAARKIVTQAALGALQRDIAASGNFVAAAVVPEKGSFYRIVADSLKPELLKLVRYDLESGAFGRRYVRRTQVGLDGIPVVEPATSYEKSERKVWDSVAIAACKKAAAGGVLFVASAKMESATAPALPGGVDSARRRVAR